MTKSLALLPLLVLPAAGITVQEARADLDGDGLPDLLGQTVTIVAVAVCEPTLFSTGSGASFYVQDATAGINVYSYKLPGFSVGPGDTLQVTGEIKQYNGLAEISPADQSDYVFVGAGAPPEPFPLVRHQGVGESVEGLLIRAGDPGRTEWVTVANDPVQSGGGWNFNVWNGDTPIAVRVSGSTGISVSGIRAGARLFVTGVGGQYDSEPPYDSGYQLLPRYQSDLQAYSPSIPLTFHLDVMGTPFAPSRGEALRLEYGGPDDLRFTIKVFDRSGREVARLVESRVGGDVMEWKGTDDRNEALPMGPYIIQLEGTGPAGERMVTTETVVVAAGLE
ncbi:MAG TPA: hypothetical protein PLF04_04250 [Candidatus Fermentibacter daniensis]|jgi:hypothetical protein|nr:MAG: hypothetical protein AO395_07380 [Candidatus Fermentibacter daniensis]MBP7720301.1 hypothetical protein [Candidatus Fermentibacter sp.]OQC70786.1 MAG: Endonuclease YhcR precursor [candidate division Hyd24-12 bacterium ADurb.Bin004]KZD18545.1 MAG: hypothetical protein AO396_10335 [Candidatus Fermentibacter daniensis]MCC6871561.1 hypothetical protein [Candidatus Fermentibacter sp.]